MTSESVVPWMFFQASGLSSWSKANRAKSGSGKAQDASRNRRGERKQNDRRTNLGEYI